MAKKKQLKIKEPVRIRFKELANGNKSVYLDIYNNGRRSYEFLKLYIIPETDSISKTANQNTLQAAKAIQAQMVLDIANKKAGIRKDYQDLLLVDWLNTFQLQRAKTGQSGKRAEQIGSAIKHVEAFNNGRIITLGDVDAKYCRDFISYLSIAKSRTSTRNPKPLSKSAAESYFVILSSALKEARRQGLMIDNPMDSLNNEDKKPIKPEGTNIGYLTIDELKAMINCTYDRQNIMLRKAFLFSCFTGFRISDVRSLIWDEIKIVDGKYYIHKLMEKTKLYVDIPLSESSLQWIPNRGESKSSDNVFPTAKKWSCNKLQSELPATQWCVNTELRRWANKAGINRHITFHMSRHTFATSLLTAGADLYITSKLLGHKNIGTTQIYADIIDQKKVDTVNLLDNLMK